MLEANKLQVITHSFGNFQMVYINFLESVFGKLNSKNVTSKYGFTETDKILSFSFASITTDLAKQCFS